jgi:uncharacterized membrane protein
VTARLLPSVLVLIAFLCVIVAAMAPVSKLKGQARLLASLSLGSGFVVNCLVQRFAIWQLLLGLTAGALLILLGLRKYRRDPQGKTPVATIL